MSGILVVGNKSVDIETSMVISSISGSPGLVSLGLYVYISVFAYTKICNKKKHEKDGHYIIAGHNYVIPLVILNRN